MRALGHTLVPTRGSSEQHSDHPARARDAAPPLTWRLDPERCAVSFAVRRLGAMWVQGTFPRLTGRLAFAMDDPVAMRCEGVIDATRMVPGAAPLNTQLRVADVLDLERHPTIPFEAHATQRLGPTELAGTATIEIRGERRELPLRIAFGEQRRIGTPTGEEASIGLRARAALTRDELLATPGRVPERQSAGRSRIDIAVHLQALLDQTLGADSSLR